MFENLTNKFEEIFSSLKKTPSLDEKQVDEGLKNIRQALIEADVSLSVAKDFIANVKLKALGQEMRVIFQGMLDLMNAQDGEGRYLFSGSETNNKPFIQDAAGDYIYNGDERIREVAVSPDSNVLTNIIGSDLDPNADFLNAMKDYLDLDLL